MATGKTGAHGPDVQSRVDRELGRDLELVQIQPQLMAETTVPVPVQKPEHVLYLRAQVSITGDVFSFLLSRTFPIISTNLLKTGLLTHYT